MAVSTLSGFRVERCISRVAGGGPLGLIPDDCVKPQEEEEEEEEEEKLVSLSEAHQGGLHVSCDQARAFHNSWLQD